MKRAKKYKNELGELEKVNEELKKLNLTYSKRAKKYRSELEELEKLEEELEDKYEKNLEELGELKKQSKFYDI